jgi:Uma2 family endonuclease
MVMLQLRQLDVPPGQRILFHDVSWLEFEKILEELGEHSASRLTYDNGVLEIVTPLPEHEDDKEIIGDLLKALLEELDLELRTLGSTTFKNQAMTKGIEPDQCFYIQNEAKIRGKKRLDLSIDPPPDIAIEIDVTSRTHPSIYEALGVPELWRRSGDRLQINILQNGKYIEVSQSPTFPNLPIAEVLLEYLEQSKKIGRNKVMKTFLQWVKTKI